MPIAVMTNEPVATCMSPPRQREESPERDVMMAEATAHMVTAYRLLEDLSVLSGALATTRSFALSTRSLLVALGAFDECCDALWQARIPAWPGPREKLTSIHSGARLRTAQ